MGKRVLIDNAVIGQYIGDTFVHEARIGNRKRTYCFAWGAGGRLTVTIGGKTVEIPPPEVAA